MTGGKPCKELNCSRIKYGSASLCYLHWRERQKKNREEKAKKKLEKKIKTKSYQKSESKKWKAKTWKLMSEWVRRKDADWRGMVQCYTCSEWLPWKEAHAGHHFHGRLDFDERNLRPQNAACNTYRGGMLNVYARRLIEENGMDWYKKLESDAAQHPGYQLHELKEIYNDLKEKISKLNLV